MSVPSRRFSPARAAAIARKEFRHVWRDPFTLGLAVGLPLFLVWIFGVAIELDAKDIRIAVDDRDHSYSSRALVDIFRNSGAFLPHEAAPGADVQRVLSSERDKAVLIVEPGLERMLETGGQPRVQIVLDGSDNAVAFSILAYLSGVQGMANARLAPAPAPVPVRLAARYLYNPELSTQWFIVPGLVVLVMGMISILLTAITVAREWENGSMERLLATQVTPLDIIAGKLVPYLLIGQCAMVLIYSLARLGFGVPFVGSHVLFLAGCLLFQTGYLGMGLLISSLSRSQQVAMQASMLTGFLPIILLSGFIFPLESMPAGFQALAGAFPAKWFMIVCRGVFLKGADAVALGLPFAVLTAMDAAILTVATLTFKTDLEP
jgi:ABC-2 type transport system permease protein